MDVAMGIDWEKPDEEKLDWIETGRGDGLEEGCGPYAKPLTSLQSEPFKIDLTVHDRDDYSRSIQGWVK